MGGLPLPGYPTLVHSYEDILVGLVLSGNALLHQGQVVRAGGRQDSPGIRAGSRIVLAIIDTLDGLN
jgi:hypothetical protein